MRKCLTVSKGPTPLICDDLWLSYVIMTIHSISVRSECWRETFAVQPVFGLAGRFVPKDMMTYDMVMLRVPVEKLVGPA